MFTSRKQTRDSNCGSVHRVENSYRLKGEWKREKKKDRNRRAYSASIVIRMSRSSQQR